MLISSQQREFMKWIVGVTLTSTTVFVLAEVPLKAMILGESTGKPSPSKQQILQPTENRGPAAQGKGSGIVEIEIHAASKGTGGIVTLEATVVGQSKQEGLRYAWLLPTEGGVTVAAGALEGEIGHLNEGQETTLQISLNQEVAENRRVHLHVYKMVGNEAMGRMAQYNTADQEKIDAKIQEKATVLQQNAPDENVQKLIQ